jgi:RNA polymerase sigma factor (sigma-70 family)
MNITEPMKPERDELIPTRWTLIERLKNWDDQESWREFFDTYWRLIHGTGIKAGLTEVEAQDLVQETVISVCKAIQEFEATPESGTFKGWLLQLTRWRIVDLMRKRAPAKPAPAQPTDSTRTPTIDRVPDPAGLALEQVWEEEWENNLITAALERLQRQTSAKHYQVFYLNAIRGVPVERVADLTGVKREQVYVIKNRLKPLFEEAVRAIEKNEP